MEKRRILIAEDDQGIREGLQFALEQEGYQVISCGGAAEARERLLSGGADLCLLDVRLPDGSGYELCTLARQRDRRIPVIFLTACDAEVSVVMGLDMGADDYITKPFRVRELLSRIRSVLRRCGEDGLPGGGARPGNTQADGAQMGGASAGDFHVGGALAGCSQVGALAGSPRVGGASVGNSQIGGPCREPGNIYFGPVTIQPDKARVYRDGREIQLTALEYRLLLAFAQNRGRILSRNQLLSDIWDAEGAGDYASDNTVSVYIKRLREKLGDDPKAPALIETVRGLGYRAAE